MKQKVFSLLAVLLFMSGSINASINFPTCEETILHIIEVLERPEDEGGLGCLDTDDYNELYSVLYNHYCN
ncbi:hypothetical protein [Paucihalobacter sp.]|uniref:hypothetical protein n=1 Tax=Paucihalobacter sp. TaxID=2850405 RepID=UPI002FE015EB